MGSELDSQFFNNGLVLQCFVSDVNFKLAFKLGDCTLGAIQIVDLNVQLAHVGVLLCNLLEVN
jgi:hypothetical protein